jgi:hypothetical protein
MRIGSAVFHPNKFTRPLITVACQLHLELGTLGTSRITPTKDNSIFHYQRREAWNAKKKMILIDSIARRVPINAITLYKTEKGGAPVYEVIDGKQRLTAVLQFKDGKISPLSESLSGLSEEEEAEGQDLANRILDKKWGDLDAGTKATFLDYEVPI